MLESTYLCPACGARIAVKQEQLVYTCEYCESKNVLLPVDGSKPEPMYSLEKLNTEDLLHRASALVYKGAFAQAQSYLAVLQEEASECSDVYILQLLCQLRLHHVDELKKIDTVLTSYEAFHQAVRFASGTQRDAYQELANINSRNIAGIRQEKEAELARLSESTEQLRLFLKQNQEKVTLPTWKKVLRIVELIFVAGSTAFWGLGTLVAPQLILLSAPFAIWLICIIRRNKKQKALPEKYAAARAQYEEQDRILQAKISDYNDWMAERNLRITPR